MHDPYRGWGGQATPEGGLEVGKQQSVVGEVAVATAPVGIPFPPLALQMPGYAQDGVEVPLLDPVGQKAADGLQAEQLEGMDPQGQQGVGLPAARTKLSVDPQLEAGKAAVDVIAPSPSMAVQLGTAECAGENTQGLGGGRPLAFDHLQFRQFNGNL